MMRGKSIEYFERDMLRKQKIHSRVYTYEKSR